MKDINGKNPENEFGLMTCKNELQKTYRIDLILTLLSDEKKIEELEVKNLNEVINEFKKTVDFGIYIDDDAFEKCVIYNKNNNGTHSFKKFKGILFSPTIIKIY